ncbi:LEF-6 [Alphabaculovirus myunipunctae]|uniref:LEF-6 n=1 Tax=Mythimna unipuncta nucleopolyhedrovirus TaxID=447897 RepID=A0A2K9VSJ3_9ABAC|nr:LEF-6 [Mythimna unipuncta nucleopolyhedrovirus]AUV65402.1 LEF-6 [Mythimna unipuncta nucleopolyhedrovirus]
MYVFYINGGHVQKRFGREFINYICGGKIRQDICVDRCTRKRCVVWSRYAADKLLAANQSAFWPDGTTFRCRLMRRSDRGKPSSRRHRQFRRSDTPIPSRKSTFVDNNRDDDDDEDDFDDYDDKINANAEDDVDDDDDDKWYTSAKFVDIDFNIINNNNNNNSNNTNNDEDSLESLHRDLRKLATTE